MIGYNKKLLCAIDYVSGKLVNDLIKILQRILKDFTHGELHTKILLHFYLVKKFLKEQYDAHASKEVDLCDTHSMRYGLDLENSGDVARIAVYDGCRFILFMINKLLSAIDSSICTDGSLKEDASRVTNYCASNLEMCSAVYYRAVHYHAQAR